MNEDDAPVTMQELNELRSQFTDLEKVVMSFAQRVYDGAGAPAPGASPGSAPKTENGEATEEEWTPIAWSDRASSQQWWELVGWVDWLRGTYDMEETREVPRCWPAHRGLANELAALHLAWQDALRNEHDGDGQSMIHWHDRWLAPLLARMRTYRIRGCHHGENHRPPTLPRPTMAGLLPSPGEVVTAADHPAGDPTRD